MQPAELFGLSSGFFCSQLVVLSKWRLRGTNLSRVDIRPVMHSLLNIIDSTQTAIQIITTLIQLVSLFLLKAHNSLSRLSLPPRITQNHAKSGNHGSTAAVQSL